MRYIILTIGFLFACGGASLMSTTMDINQSSRDNAGIAFFIGVAFIILGAIMAVRAGRKDNG